MQYILHVEITYSQKEIHASLKLRFYPKGISHRFKNDMNILTCV